MSENLYEGMFLLDSGKFAADHDGVSNQLVGMLEKAGGKVSAHRAWQEGRLAYLIKRQRKGVHYLAYFEMEGTGLKDLNRACRLNGVILRHFVIKQPKVLFDAMVNALCGNESTDEVPDDKKGAGDAKEAGKAGYQIVFQSDRDGGMEVYAMDGQ